MHPRGGWWHTGVSSKCVGCLISLYSQLSPLISRRRISVILCSGEIQQRGKALVEAFVVQGCDTRDHRPIQLGLERCPMTRSAHLLIWLLSWFQGSHPASRPGSRPFVQNTFRYLDRRTDLSKNPIWTLLDILGRFLKGLAFILGSIHRLGPVELVGHLIQPYQSRPLGLFDQAICRGASNPQNILCSLNKL